MSASRISGLLLRLYPPGWRERYGEEMQALIVESIDGKRVPWRVRLDVALAGGRERLRSAGLDSEGAPDHQVRGGVLLVLCAWSLFLVGGVGVQKFSEHWQDATPAASRALPTDALTTLATLAGCAGLLVLVGIGCTLPALTAFARAGGWAAVRRRFLSAALLTGLTIAAIGALVVWAHGLSATQRSGHDAAYASLFVACALLGIACLFAWTVAAVAVARRLQLKAQTLSIEAWIAVGVTIAMSTMTVATVVWWVAIADAAPRFLTGHAVGAPGSALVPQLTAAVAAMLLASLLGHAGSRRALRALPAVTRPHST